ncbi:site-specific integrase [Streptococcus equi subsp. zooepidemicus]|uniref:tyrosine-type recombinase/integrase n=1 Tax=Streptococcus equi TaxID=1336 RepID=UPI001E293BF3|nr:site-specific integrase [Streptococcus equi]MCD3380004.1 site-specific integrase [Streptococcus equi subsp. zooepidemicus]MCD3409331.1 site-specific integrase [Streptococcus equi subsp. zooepidemicus]MCD3464810.1 site-specific integrase [Streptococcus equi subsp. zooepidemicus]HEL0663231.1 site-specific integrase [Streptococcus equi subsp. zooepidemicus]HEL1205262.1 site-specific integrase [Streptococcus equi subsp. zooepidemicus]
MARIRKRGKNWEYEIKRNGKVVYRGNGFKRKKDAEKKAKEIEVMLDNQLDYQVRADVSLVELFDAWLTVEVFPQPLQTQTIKKYEKRRQKIETFFGDTKVSDILRSQYQSFINWYGQSYEINELGRMNANIRKALEFAKADKLLIDDRFLLNVKLNSKKTPKKAEYKFLKSRADYDVVIDYLMTFMDYRHSVVDFVVYILFKCGLRPAEALCLRWEHVDFANQELFTNERWNSVEHKIVPPKNDHYFKKINHPNPSIRHIPFDRQVKQVLLKLKKQQEMTCRLLNVKNSSGYIFFQAGAKWELPDESTVNKRVKKIIKELKIKPVITAYGARHTYGSVKVQEGVPLEVLARWFGHKDTSMLRSIYIHLLDETRNEWFEREKKSGGQIGGQVVK